MAEIDYLLKGVKISVDDVVNIKALYNFLRRWINKMGYDFYEKEHIEDMKPEDIRNLNVKMESEKKVDDYTKFHIELRMKGNGLKAVMRDKELCASGTVSISFDVFLENDYEGKGDKPFYRKFFRTVYDKYVVTERYEKNVSELKDEANDLINKTKAFLKLEDFKK